MSLMLIIFFFYETCVPEPAADYSPNPIQQMAMRYIFILQVLIYFLLNSHVDDN